MTERAQALEAAIEKARQGLIGFAAEIQDGRVPVVGAVRNHLVLNLGLIASFLADALLAVQPPPPVGSPTTAWIPTDGCDCATCNVARRSTPVASAGASEPPSEADNSIVLLISAASAASGYLERQQPDLSARLWSAVQLVLEHVQPTHGEPAPCVWRDIASAPKDGIEILLCRGDRVSAGSWLVWTQTMSEYHGATGVYLGQSEQDGGECWMTLDGGFREEEPPTHWMPLPAPPSTPEGSTR